MFKSDKINPPVKGSNSIGACKPDIGTVFKMTPQVGMEIFYTIAATEKNRFERVEDILPGIPALGSNARQMCMAELIDFQSV